MVQIIISINPKYCNSILSGKKTVEFRKESIEKVNLKAIMYSTAPIRKFVGIFYVKNIYKNTIQNLWKQFGKKGEIMKEDYFKYFKDKEFGYALVIDRVRKFKTPINPNDYIPNYIPPQSFKYLNTEEMIQFSTLFPQIKTINDFF